MNIIHNLNGKQTVSHARHIRFQLFIANQVKSNQIRKKSQRLTVFPFISVLSRVILIYGNKKIFDFDTKDNYILHRQKRVYMHTEW